MMTLRSLICLLENQNGGKLQKSTLRNSFVKVHLNNYYASRILNLKISQLKEKLYRFDSCLMGKLMLTSKLYTS
jgi:hypothetical protein